MSGDPEQEYFADGMYDRVRLWCVSQLRLLFDYFMGLGSLGA
jgi:hypothetical protein